MTTTAELTPPSKNDITEKYITKKEALKQGLSIGNGFVLRPPTKAHGFDNSNVPAQIVSFTEKTKVNLSTSYNNELSLSYMEQCFHNTVKMGEGSFGVVFKAQSTDDGKYYAIKKSKRPFRSKSDKKTKLEEVRKYEKIPKHPNCVELYYAWTQDDYLFILMELCDSNLESYAAGNHNISEEKIWTILLHMLLAVKNLHDAELIHLDIKLENIFMYGDNVFKLGDFGLVTDMNSDDCIEGDSKYLAPEVLNGSITKAADIFSLGMVILELASDLVLPKNGVLWHELRSNKLPLCYLESRSSELINIVKLMMQRDYLKRPTVDDLLKMPRLTRMIFQRKFMYYINTFTRICFAENFQFLSCWLNYFYHLPLQLLSFIKNKLKTENPALLPAINNYNGFYALPVANSTPQSSKDHDILQLKYDPFFRLPDKREYIRRYSNPVMPDGKYTKMWCCHNDSENDTGNSSYQLSATSTPLKRKRDEVSPIIQSAKRKPHVSQVGRKLFADE